VRGGARKERARRVADEAAASRQLRAAYDSGVIAPEWLEGAFDVVPVAIVVIDRSEGRILSSNLMARQLFEVSQTKSDVDGLNGVLGSGALAAVVLAADTADPQEQIAPRFGKIVRYELEARPLVDDPSVLVVAIRDKTESRVDQEIADLARFPEKNPGPVVWFDRSGAVLLANAAARRAFGGDALLGSSWLAACPGFNEAHLAEVLNAPDIVTFETQVDETWFSIAYVRSDADSFVFAFGTDVTARRHMEQRVAEYARFPDMNPGPVLRVNLDGSVLLANAAARAVFETEVVGQCWFDIYPGSRQRWDEIVAAEVPISLEARIGDGDYVFAHRSDPATRLVFVFGADITNQKQAESQLRQSEKMATLGTLVAGVAHELNNPAAATRRAADHLREAFARLERANRELAGADLDGSAIDLLADLDDRARTHAGQPSTLDTVRRADLEADVEDWLDDHSVADTFDLAPALVEQGVGVDALDSLAAELGEPGLALILQWSAAAFPVYRLAYEIGEGSSRISEIVAALKSYSYLGQAPVQAVDVHEGIDNTLVILRSKLKKGVEVRREYATDLPRITAYGSELNQVWTNLLDNAVDAMGGEGIITIRTRADGAAIVVEIEDDGPGITVEDVGKVFDPFFTTKDPGRGTGLGLATSYSIVKDKHLGAMDVHSRPGSTCFTVRLPIDADPDRRREQSSWPSQ
jgi:signal transduction histidine kinase